LSRENKFVILKKLEEVTFLQIFGTFIKFVKDIFQ